MESGAPDQENSDRIYGIGAAADEKKKSRSHRHSNTTTPRGVAGSSEKNTPQHNRVDSGDFDDHMQGSTFNPADICKGCGFPRSSSVWCPVTQRHHGTDEVMATSSHHHRRGSTGNAGLKFIKGVLNKVSPQHNSPGNTPTESCQARAAGLPPLSPSHQPPPGQENAAAAGTTGACDGKEGGVEGEGAEVGEDGADSSVHYVQGPDGYYYAYTPGNDGDGDDNAEGGAGDNAEGGAEEGDPEAHVQYYCYTDENGETFYYAAEMEESVSILRQQSQSTNRATGKAGDDGEGHDTNNADNYRFELKDESGNSMQYVMQGPRTPHVDGIEDGDTAAAHAGSPAECTSAANEEEGGGAEVAEAPKKKKTFGDTLVDFFKPKKGKKDKGADKHVDPNGGGADAEGDSTTNAADGGDATVLNSRKTDNGTGGIASVAVDGVAGEGSLYEAEEERRRTVDAAVVDFSNMLDGAEKKKFEKERKKLVKELEAAEKKERDHLAKQRKVFTEDLDRERRAGLFVLQSDGKIVKRGAAKGEPL